MEQIIIEVDDSTAKKWRTTSSKFKKVITEKFEKDVDFISKKFKNDDFMAALDEIGESLAKRGLTEEKVDEILNSDD